MPDPKASLAAAQAAGLATPQPSDFIHRGDDAITLNARFTADALTDAATARAEVATRAAAGDGLQPAGDDAVIFAVVDEAGRRTVLELGPDGNLTPYAAGKLAGSPEVVSALGTGVGLAPIDDPAAEVIFAVVDEDGRRTELEVDRAGRVPARVLSAWAARMGNPTGTAAGSDFPTRDWAAWGDSFTGNSWPGTFATELGVNVYNGGVGGQKTAQIAARQGGTPARVTVAGNTVPADGPVSVTAITSTPLSGGQTRTGTLAGVAGALSRSADGLTHTFTRDAPGTAVAVTPGTAFIPADGATRRDRTVVIWTGRNDLRPASEGATASTPLDEILPRVRSMIDYLTPKVRRVLVLEIAPRDDETPGTVTRTRLDDYNRALAAAFPEYWVPIATWLRTDEAAAAAGVTLTDLDRQDITNGITPRSLRSDVLHLNEAGNAAVVARIKTEAQKRGWI